MVRVNGRICNTTKSGENPVLSSGTSGSWDEGQVWNPTVIKEENLYKMWYTGNDASGSAQKGLAISPDGIDWTKEAAQTEFRCRSNVNISEAHSLSSCN